MYLSFSRNLLFFGVFLLLSVTSCSSSKHSVSNKVDSNVKTVVSDTKKETGSTNIVDKTIKDENVYSDTSVKNLEKTSGDFYAKLIVYDTTKDVDNTGRYPIYSELYVTNASSSAKSIVVDKNLRTNSNVMSNVSTRTNYDIVNSTDSTVRFKQHVKTNDKTTLSNPNYSYLIVIGIVLVLVFAYFFIKRFIP